MDLKVFLNLKLMIKYIRFSKRYFYIMCNMYVFDVIELYVYV